MIRARRRIAAGLGAMRIFLMSLREPAVWQTPGVVAAGR
jgi:hypothetical protein